MNHGTSTAYKYGCRCDVCRTMQSARVKAWRQGHKPAAPPAPRRPIPATDWMDDAACRDRHVSEFFPVARSGHTPYIVAAAKQVCATCPVARQCLDYALALDIGHGVFGGTTPEERRDIKKAGAA